MSASEGLRIISIAKALQAFQRGDPNISQYFGITLLSGNAGLFLAALRGHRKMSWKKFRALATAAHIESPLLRSIIFPWMQKGGFVDGILINDNSEILCNVLDHSAVLSATSALFRSQDPTPEELAVIELVDLGAQLPRLKSEVSSIIAGGDDHVASRATELAKAYKIVNVLEGTGIAEPIIYSPLIWGDKIGKAGKALSHLTAQRREVLLKLVDMIRIYQGMPLTSAVNWVKQQGEPDLVTFAVGVGLLDKTQIVAGGTGSSEFLTTPHIYGELAATQGKDVCDRVRLFLDSIRHGEHFGSWYTGRIMDPNVLLGKLLNAGEIGPCTAIGHDYQLVEKAGIINVKPSKYKTGQFVMELCQNDTVRLVRDIVSKKSPLNIDSKNLHSTCDQNGFVSAEGSRAQLGEQPQRVREAEQEMLRQLREM